MTGLSGPALWGAIAALGFGTWLIRFSFIGFLGGRKMPDLAIRLLRFVPVTVLPAMAAPLVVWPEASGGALDPARLFAGLAALATGMATRSLLGGIFAGMSVLYAMQALLG